LVVSFETLEHLAEQEEMMSEIVRVLRPEGQLIISSPNKLVYSDLPAYHNPYHVRELYFDEFRELLLRHFPSCAIFGHRIFAASAVHPLGGVTVSPHWLGMSDLNGASGLPALPSPTYFLAVCARREGVLDDLASVYIDPHHDLLPRLWDTLPIVTSGAELALADYSEPDAVPTVALPPAEVTLPSLSPAEIEALQAALAAERDERARLHHALEEAQAAFIAADERTAAEAVQRAQREASHADALASLEARLRDERAARESAGAESRLAREVVEAELLSSRTAREALEAEVAEARDQLELAAAAARELLERERAAQRELQRRAAEAELENHQLHTVIGERESGLKRAYGVVNELREEATVTRHRFELELAESRALAALVSARLAALEIAASDAADQRVATACARDLDMETLQAALASTSALLKSAQTERDRVTAELHETRSAIEAMTSSRSWRMTATLRNSAAALRGRRQG
jgi:hypothetical protein